MPVSIYTPEVGMNNSSKVKHKDKSSPFLNANPTAAPVQSCDLQMVSFVEEEEEEKLSWF